MPFELNLCPPHRLAAARQSLKFQQTPRYSVAFDGGDHLGVALPAVVRTANFPTCCGMNDQPRDLVVVTVDATVRVNHGMGSLNHVNQRPQPWRTILVVSVEPVDDRPPLNVHRIDGNFVRPFSNGFNPANAVIQGIGLAHERGFEHQVGLDSEIEGLKIGHGAVPRSSGESFVDVETEHFIVVGFQANGYRERRVD